MCQVYDALRDLTDECGSVYLGDVLVYSSTTAVRRKHLWMVLDWLLGVRLNAYAMVCDFWSVRCRSECILDLDCGFRWLPLLLPAPRAPPAASCTNGVDQPHSVS